LTVRAKRRLKYFKRVRSVDGDNTRGWFIPEDEESESYLEDGLYSDDEIPIEQLRERREIN